MTQSADAITQDAIMSFIHYICNLLTKILIESSIYKQRTRGRKLMNQAVNICSR